MTFGGASGKRLGEEGGSRELGNGRRRKKQRFSGVSLEISVAVDSLGFWSSEKKHLRQLRRVKAVFFISVDTLAKQCEMYCYAW